MKVLFIALGFPLPANSGAAIATLETLRSIHSLCDLHLLSPQPETEHAARVAELEQLLPGVTLHFYERRPIQAGRFEMYKTAVQTAFSGKTYWGSMWMNPKLRLAVKSLAAKHDFDVVHCDWLQPAVSLRGLDLPVLIRTLDVHFPGMIEWANDPAFGGKLRKLYWQTQGQRFRRFEAETLRAVPVVVTVSAEDEAVLRREGVSQVVTIPPPREVEPEVASRESNERPIMLFMGRLDMPVNREAFFVFTDKVLPHVGSETRARVNIIFAGGFPDEAVRRRATECDIEIRAPLSNEEARELLAQAELFLSPVISGTGIKIKTLEAMANGKAIIGFAEAFRGVPLQDGVHALIANSPEEFARSIEELAQDPSKSRRIGQAAREFVRLNYDPATLAARLVGAYSQTIEKFHQSRSRGDEVSTTSR